VAALLIFGPAGNPAGAWRLSQRKAEAQGWLEKVEATNFHEGGGEHENGTPIYRCEYTFRLPDGTPMRGTCYTLGEKFRLPRAAPGQPPPRLPVTVEYDPANPATSRIQGTRTSPYTPWVLLVLLFPAIAFLVAAIGFALGRRRLHLLREGQAVQATVTACLAASGDDAVMAQYKQQLAQWRERFRGHPLILLGRGFLGLWTCGAVGILIFGIVILGGMLVMLLVMPTPPRERALWGLGVSGFLALWLTFGLFMVRSGRAGYRAMNLREGELPPPQPVRCTFEFRTAEGQVVQARAVGRVGDRPGDEPPQPALYDPRYPRRALLLSGLWPAVRVGPDGGWETTAGPDAGLRLLLVLALLAGPFAVWACFL
jgi:hypothetical protein